MRAVPSIPEDCEYSPVHLSRRVKEAASTQLLLYIASRAHSQNSLSIERSESIERETKKGHADCYEQGCVCLINSIIPHNSRHLSGKMFVGGFLQISCLPLALENQACSCQFLRLGIRKELSHKDGLRSLVVLYRLKRTVPRTTLDFYKIRFHTKTTTTTTTKKPTHRKKKPDKSEPVELCHLFGKIRTNRVELCHVFGKIRTGLL